MVIQEFAFSGTKAQADPHKCRRIDKKEDTECSGGVRAWPYGFFPKPCGPEPRPVHPGFKPNTQGEKVI